MTPSMWLCNRGQLGSHGPGTLPSLYRVTPTCCLDGGVRENQTMLARNPACFGDCAEPAPLGSFLVACKEPGQHMLSCISIFRPDSSYEQYGTDQLGTQYAGGRDVTEYCRVCHMLKYNFSIVLYLKTFGMFDSLFQPICYVENVHELRNTESSLLPPYEFPSEQ